MPPLNVAIRAAAAVAALGAGTTAGIATAAVHAQAGVHAETRHTRERRAEAARATQLYMHELEAALAKYSNRSHKPTPAPAPARTTSAPVTTTPATTTANTPPATTTPATTTPATTTTKTTPTTTTPTTTSTTTTTTTTSTATTTSTTPTSTTTPATPTTTTTPTTTPTTTTPTTTTPTTTPTTTTPTTTTTTTTSATPVPTGVAGNWNLVFDDEFNGTSLNTTVWNNHDGWTDQNNVTDHASNITEGGGYLTLTLASSTSGATIGTNQDVFAVGDFAEARVYFAGNGTSIYNWPAWWASGPDWPAAGENDIAEGLGTLTVNYHSPAGADNTGTVAGTWSNAFHTFGIYRGSNYCDVYYDGVLVRHYTTDDNGAAQELLFTMGAANTLEYGATGEMKVDYVRVWAPA